MRREQVTMARKAIAYSRFSGKRQEAGDSQRRQDAMAEQAAREEGVELDRTICLSDKGVSAFRGDNWKRGDLGKFIDLVDAGVIPAGTILIVEQVNRVSRLPWMDQVELWKEILSRGIVIRSCQPPARYTRENMNDLAVGCPVVIYMMLGHLESEQKSDWVRKAWGEKKKAAAAGRTPHGRSCPQWLRPVCTPHPQDSSRTVTTGYELIPERAGLVRQIFAWSVAGWGAWRIVRELKAAGVPPWRPCRPPPEKGGRRHKRGGWTPSGIRWLLGCRHVVGEYQPMVRGDDGTDEPAGPPVPDYYPVVIDEDTWQAAQAARCGRRRKGGRPGDAETNLFTRLVREATSGWLMHCHHSAVRGERYRYLITHPCTQGVPYQPFEDAVLDALAGLKASDVDGSHQADELNARVNALREEQTRLDLALQALDAQTAELSPERWPARVVARMADLEDALRAKKEEVRLAEEAANSSGRVAALTEVQTCVQLLARVRGTAEERAVRVRIKTRLPLLLEAVWVRVQPINRLSRYLHIRLYLQGGEQRYYVKYVAKGKGEPSVGPWRLAGADFRQGEVGGDAVDAEALPQPDALALAR
jgi:DNA invertase Pin-like site-specific DNA recombinase